jgi:hypothetical protein
MIALHPDHTGLQTWRKLKHHGIWIIWGLLLGAAIWLVWSIPIPVSLVHVRPAGCALLKRAGVVAVSAPRGCGTRLIPASRSASCKLVSR